MALKKTAPFGDGLFFRFKQSVLRILIVWTHGQKLRFSIQYRQIKKALFFLTRSLSSSIICRKQASIQKLYLEK